MASTIAAVGNLGKKIDGKNWSPKAIALSVAGFAVALIPAGLFLSWGVDLYRNAEVAKDQKKVLAKYYRSQIAAELGIDPNSVGHRELDMAAKTNPAFAKLVRKVDLEKERADRASHMSNGAAKVATFGGIIPGSGLAAKGVTEAVSGVAGGFASMLFNKDTLTVQDVVSVIDEKTAQGAPIEAVDVMLLRIAQDEGLQEEIQKQFKKPLHKMNEVEQRSVLAAMPDLYQLADRDAQAVNTGRLKHQDLIMVSPGQQQQAFGQFTARHGSRGGRQGSWAQQVNSQRATAPTQGRVV
ncbi:MAG: hypothetical protein J0M34_00875 [Alphaproteobacteria bacterium]|nr:hypothetical protein [Alphaproteobacteria bacterium]